MGSDRQAETNWSTMKLLIRKVKADRIGTVVVITSREPPSRNGADTNCAYFVERKNFIPCRKPPALSLLFLLGKNYRRG